jgi:hypothetical protein
MGGDREDPGTARADLVRLVERAPSISPLRRTPPATAVVSSTPEPAGTTATIAGGGPRPGVPTRVSIPDADVDADVYAAPTTPEGMAVPPADRAGWHDAGPRPGEPGRAVLIGHRDSATGPAVFAAVPDLEPGAEVSVTDSAGVAHAYRVTRVATAPKSRFPTELVFGPTRASELVLVTCGGPFTPGRGYRDNVVAFARAS